MQKVEGSSPFIRFVSFPIPLRPVGAATVLAAVALAPVVVGGCGSSGDATASTTRAASTGCVATTYRCTRVQITNALSQSVAFDVWGAEQGDQRLTLAPGATGTVTGYNSRGGGDQLVGDIWLPAKAETWDAAPANARMVMKARNPMIGTPCLGFHLQGPAKLLWCVKISEPAAGATSAVQRYDAGWSTVSWQRLPNTTNFIEYTATVRPA